MGFWNKLGKIALQAAPFIAAPFTGGASLAFTPATRQLGQKWAQHDAESDARKGLGPSRFDSILGAASEGAGMYGGSGGFGGSSRRYPMDEKIGIGMDEGGFGGGGRGGWQDILNQVMNRGIGGGMNRGQGAGDYSYGRGNEQATSRGNGQMGVSRFGRRMQRQLGPVMGAEDQSNPNLALSIGAGRMDAIRNQPWRGGYDVSTQEQDDSGNNIGDPTTATMPSIYPAPRRRQMYQ